MDLENISTTRKVLAAALYGSTSFFIVIVNKNVLTAHGYVFDFLQFDCRLSYITVKNEFARTMDDLHSLSLQNIRWFFFKDIAT